MNRRKIEAWVWESIEELLYNSEPFDERIFEAQKKHEADETSTELARGEAEKRISAIARGEQRILRLIAGSEDADFIGNAETQLRQLAADRARAKSDIEKLERAKTSQNESSSQLEQLLLWTVSNSERPTTPEGRREILKLLGVKVSANKSEWKISLSLAARTSDHNILVNGTQVQTIVIASRAA